MDQLSKKKFLGLNEANRDASGVLYAANWRLSNQILGSFATPQS
jgi:hypothetical protein